MIETSVAGFTVSVVEPDTAPKVAVIMVDPDVTLVARPGLPEALLMVATVVVAELHCTV